MSRPKSLPARSPSELLRSALARYSAAFARAADGHAKGVPTPTAHQFRLLSHLSRSVRCSQFDLTGRTDIDRSTLSEMLRRLERRGLVIVEDDPSDMRRSAVSLTAKGEAVCRHMQAYAVTAERELLRPLARADATRLVALLGRIADG